MDTHTAVIVKRSTKRHLSRYGCRNCKLRKLKCDETRPHCKKCRTYGVACNFGYNVPDLQPLRQNQVSQEVSLTPPRALISNSNWSSNESSFLNLDQQDQELFYQFRCRTVYSLGDAAFVSIYENKIYQDAFTCPALMHGLLAMASVHTRYLTTPTPPRSFREIHHSSQCTILFNKWLNQPIQETQKDAMWATAVTLSNLAFSSIDVSSSEQAWPLKISDASDLQWLRLKGSDKALWQLANPMREGSVFREVMVEMFELMHRSLPLRGVEGVDVELVELCGLHELSNPENNPYFGFAHALSRLLEVPKGEASLGQVFLVVNAISDELRTCLEEKDPVALILLYLWYSRARECRWWIDLRARYEMPAIRIYLQRHHRDIGIMQTLLEEYR